MGNILVAYLRLRSEYALVPHPILAAAHARGARSKETYGYGLQSVPYIAPSLAAERDPFEEEEEEERPGHADDDDGDSDEGEQQDNSAPRARPQLANALVNVNLSPAHPHDAHGPSRKVAGKEEEDGLCRRGDGSRSGSNNAASDDSAVKAGPPTDAAAIRRGQPPPPMHRGEQQTMGHSDAGLAGDTQRRQRGSPPPVTDRGFSSFFFTIPGHTDGDGARSSGPPLRENTKDSNANAQTSRTASEHSRKQRRDTGAVSQQGSTSDPAGSATAAVAGKDGGGGGGGEEAGTTTATTTTAEGRRSVSSSHGTSGADPGAWGLLLGRNSSAAADKSLSGRTRRGPSAYASALKRRLERGRDGSPAAAALRVDTLALHQAQERERRKKGPQEDAAPPSAREEESRSVVATTASPPLSPLSSLSSVTDMGPMDCADAFLYFHPDEGTFQQQESSVYRAPEAAGVSLAELRERYLSGRGCCPRRRSGHEDSARLGESPHGAPSATGQGSDFVSLAECLQQLCADSALPAVAWRRVERPTVAAIQPGQRRNRRGARPMGKPTTATDAAAAGAPAPLRVPQAEDGGDEASSCGPGSACSPTSLPTSRTGGAGAAPLFSDSDVDDDEAEASNRKSMGRQAGDTVCYLGPQQHMTYQLLWTKVVSFGWGLRSLGLRAGSTVGLCSDTRWEWLVTVYACWTQGLIPVVFHTNERCLATMATEGTEMKVVVCGSSLVPTVRRHIRAAMALAQEVEEQMEVPDAMRRRRRHAKERAHPSPSPSPPQQPDSQGEGQPSAPSSRRPKRRTRAMPLFVAMRDLVSGDSQQELFAGSFSGTTSCDGGGEEEEEEEAEPLWWADVLEHGEGKLFEHRNEQLRLWKETRRRQALEQQQQRQQHLLRLRQQQHEQQHQHFTRVGATDSGTSVAGATSTQLTATNNSSASSGGGGQRSGIGRHGGGAAASTQGLQRQQQQQQQLRRRHPHHGLPPRIGGDDVATANSAPVIRAQSRISGAPPPPRFIVPSHSNNGSGGGAANSGEVLIDSGPFVLSSSVQTPLRATDLAMIVYTEGDPKGVMLTHGALKASVTAYQERLRELGLLDGDHDSHDAAAPGSRDGLVPSLKQRDTNRPSQHRRTYVAYLPQHHLLEFLLETTLLLEGYLVCFGSRQTLFDDKAKPHGDLTEYKPLLLMGTPDIYARVCRTVEGTLSTGGYRRLIFDVGYEERRLALQRGLDTPYLNTTVFSQPRQMLGGRCRLALSCGGPLHPRVEEYLQIVTGATVLQVYAPLEAGGCGLFGGNSAGEQLLDCLGGPLGAVEVKLRDVKDNKGLGTSKGGGGGWSHRGVRPCGELLLRGPTIASGYYRQVEKAAEVLEEGGWMHTGDIVERLPGGGFRLRARLSAAATRAVWNSTGHRFCLEALEAVYGRHPLCTAASAAVADTTRSPTGNSTPSLCVLVHPHRPYLCALLLTDEQCTRAFLSHHQTQRFLQAFHTTTGTAVTGDDASMLQQRQQWPSCLHEAAFSAAAAASLNYLGRHAGGLRSFEQLRHVRVLQDRWGTGNGLCSPTGKVNRAAIEARYANIIADMFAEEQMLPSDTNLDFYAPPPNHRSQAKQRLNHQREDMFSWRSDAKETSFHPVTGERVRSTAGFAMGPRQTLLKDSQRAADAAAAERKKNEDVWTSASAASVVAPDRRREWRKTGFVFEKSHFRSTAGGPPHGARGSSSLGGRVQDPYIPYFHDGITFCEPSSGKKSETAHGSTAVTAFAVTCNRTEAEEAVQQENASSESRSNLMGPALASRQKAVELAENMYESLVTRQAVMTGTAVGSPESLDVRLPTSELAYTLRQSYVNKGEPKRVATQREPRAQARTGSTATVAPGDPAAPHHQCRPQDITGLVQDSSRSGTSTFADTKEKDSNETAGFPADFSDRSRSSDNSGAIAVSGLTQTRANSNGSNGNEGEHGDGLSVYPPYVADRCSTYMPTREPSEQVAGQAVDRNAFSSYGGGGQKHPTQQQQQPDENDGEGEFGGEAGIGAGALPAEAKAVRLYAITLKKAVTDQDTTMLHRQEIARRGVPVVLPDAWRSPMSY